MSFPRYSAYKESKNDWVAHVPEHWELMPCRGFVDERTEKNEDAACQSYLSLMANVGIIPYEEKGDIGNKKPEDLSKCKIVYQGDFVINSMNYGIGSYGVSAYEGVCSPVYIVLTPRQAVVEPRFAFRIFEDKRFQAYAQSLGNGILAHRCAIGWDDLKGIVVGIPSAAEQKSILNFLDRETAKIDTLISEQKRLVEIFKLKLSSLALSGFQDEEPNYQRIGRVTRIISRPVDIKVDEEYEPLGLFNRGRGIFHKESRRGADMGDSDFFYVEAGDLVLSGQFAWEGSVAVADKSESGCVVSHRYPIIQGDNENCLTEFLIALLWTEHGDFVLNQCSRGAAGRNRPLNLGLLLKEEIALPCLTIQRAIQEEYRKYVGLKNEQAKQTGLALERRSALISAAVTGQIDVRGFVEVEGSEL